MKLSPLLYGATALSKFPRSIQYQKAKSIHLVSTAEAQNSTFCTTAPIVCYAVTVPASTTSTNDSTIFFQITGPSTMSWMGFGQGTEMAGSNLFVIYANEEGTNVTLSPRLGTGEVMPMEDTTAQAELLEGSGVGNGMMTANIKCKFNFFLHFLLTLLNYSITNPRIPFHSHHTLSPY